MTNRNIPFVEVCPNGLYYTGRIEGLADVLKRAGEVTCPNPDDFFEVAKWICHPDDIDSALIAQEQGNQP